MIKEQKKFGIKDDGWDEEDLCDVISSLERAEEILNELKNYCRGTGGISGDKIQNLKNDLDELSENIVTATLNLP